MIDTMQPWHLLYVVMNARKEDLAEIDMMSEVGRQKWACRRALEPGIAFSVLRKDGLPVACFGLIEESSGVAMAWLLATPEWCPYLKSVFRAWKIIVKESQYRRIQALAQPDRPGAKKFLLWMGFKFDGSLQKFCSDGSSMDLYSRV